MMMGGMNMNPAMKQGPMNNMNMMGPRHPAMMQAGASNNPAGGGQGWPPGGQGGPQGGPGGPQGGPGPGMGHPHHRMSPGRPSQQHPPGGPPNNSSMSQQTLSSPMSRQSPSVMSGPNSGDNPGPMQGPGGPGPGGPGPNMNPRLQNMGNMPQNIPIEGQRGSPGLPQGQGDGGGMMGHRPGPHPPHMRNGGPGPGQQGPGAPNFPGNMPNQMSQQMSMNNVRMGMPGMGPGQHPGMGPGPGGGMMGPGGPGPGMGHPQHRMSPGHPSQHQGPGGQPPRLPQPPGPGPQQPQTMAMTGPGPGAASHGPPGGHGSPMNMVPASPHTVPQSPLSTQHPAASPMSHPHMSPHPNMSPHPSHTPQHSNTPTHQPGSRDDINLDFLENISPTNAKSQTPLTTTPNDQ